MQANWKPLEDRLGPARCAGFMYMGRINGVNLYKHGLSRRYLNLSDEGRAFRQLDRGRFEEIPFSEALAWVAEPLAAMGETLESAYDEEYRARRSEALRAAGIEELRLQVVPDEVTSKSTSAGCAFRNRVIRPPQIV
jgi:hypothetical protein